MRPISPDLRQRIVTARFEEGLTMGQIAKRFQIPRGTVQNIVERYRDAGTIEPRPAKAGRPVAIEGDALRRLEKDVQTHPDATLAELLERSGLAVTYVTIHNTLKRLGFTRKKKRYTRRSNSGPTSSRGAGRGSSG